MEYLEQGSLKSEAKTACMAIAIAIRSSHPAQSDQALEKIEKIFGIKQINVVKGEGTIVSVSQCSLKKPMQLETDKNGVLYMIVPNGLGYANMDPGQGGQAILHFTAENKGTLKMQFEINGSDIDNDSWHFKLDDNDFATWNDNVTSGWQWKNFNKEYMIEKGRHVLIINQREDGSKMSNIKLTLE